MSTPQFKAIRRASVPICAIETQDPAQTIAACVKLTANGKAEETIFVEWDIVRGLTPVYIGGKAVNEISTKFCSDLAPSGIECQNPAECLSKLAQNPKARVLVFWHNAHRFIVNADVSQGIWNLRDIYKAMKSTLVLLAPVLTLPDELKQDVVILSEPLPDEVELSRVIDSTVKGAKQDPATFVKDRPRVIDTLRGLSAFAAEQVVAMSMNKEGIDQAGLWERKKKMIEQTPGLSVWQGGETFADLGGLGNLKDFLTRVLTSGKTPVRAIGFIDEIEKGLAGAGGDTSGTSQDQLQVFLKVMQDLNIPGIILLGPAGTGKSAIAKAAGNVAQCPVVAIDTGSMKGSLVGESERRIRTAMEVFKAVSQGKGLFIATCNKIASLPPELRRRFTLGTFFVDLPTAEDRKAIWKIWAKQYGLAVNPSEIPECEDWTGAEVKACCDVSFRTGLSLKESARFVVPVAKSAADQLGQLRQLATGRFICASNPGIYAGKAQTISTGRNMED